MQNLNLNSGLPLPLTPATSVATELEYRGLDRLSPRLHETYLSVRSQVVLSQKRVDRNERTTPGSSLVDVGVGTELTFGEREVHLRIGVGNLFNVAYFNHISRYRLINLPEQGRNVTLSAKAPLWSK